MPLKKKTSGLQKALAILLRAFVFPISNHNMLDLLKDKVVLLLSIIKNDNLAVFARQHQDFIKLIFGAFIIQKLSICIVEITMSNITITLLFH